MNPPTLDPSQWYRTDIGGRLKPQTINVYRKWTGLDGKDLVEHLHKIRNRAWPQGRYPCVGLWMFLLPSISALNAFESVVSVLRETNEAAVLDLGCCFGQDLRLLATHGVPTHHMWALDKDPMLWNLGFDLFQDKGRMKATFVQADFLHDCEQELLAADVLQKTTINDSSDVAIFDSTTTLRHPSLPVQLESLRGSTTVILACQFLHLFSLPLQTIACVKIVALSKPGTILIGYQQSRKLAREYMMPWGAMYYHTATTWHAMWRTVEQLTRTEWEVYAQEVELTQWGMEESDYQWMPDDRQGLNFTCKRLR